jgi:Transposase DDE domain
MDRPAKDGRHLADLVQLAIPLCKAAQSKCSGRGPGRPPDYEEWQIAVLIVIAILHRQKSKSSQWRFLKKHQQQLMAALTLRRFPCRDTYSRRYCNAGRLLDIAVELQGKLALKEHVCNAQVVAVDKSLVKARGPHPRRGKVRKGSDREAGWGMSNDGLLWSYSYEAVVSAPENGLVFPVLASVDIGSKSEHKSFAQKIPRLSSSVRDVLLDRGYDGNASAEALEYRANGKPSGRRYVCPAIARAGKPAVGKCVRRGRRELLRLHRQKRVEFFASKKGRSLYRLRRQTVEPFNAHLKKLFELEDRVWHRGLDNNRTMILAAIFSYQLLLRHAFKRGQRNRQLQWILDGL